MYDIYIHIYLYIYIYMCIYVYTQGHGMRLYIDICIYIYRERERSVYVYIYISPLSLSLSPSSSPSLSLTYKHYRGHFWEFEYQRVRAVPHIPPQPPPGGCRRAKYVLTDILESEKPGLFTVWRCNRGYFWEFIVVPASIPRRPRTNAGRSRAPVVILVVK